MRLFVAINFDDWMKRALLDVQDKMRLQGVRGNYTKPESLLPLMPKDYADIIKGRTMTVNHISLMRSDRGKNGMIYTEL